VASGGEDSEENIRKKMGKRGCFNQWCKTGGVAIRGKS